MVAWDLFSFVGVMAYAASGAVVAIEEQYDMFGVCVLGFVTSFGGGILRNVVVGIPLKSFWSQTSMFLAAFGTLVAILLLPTRWLLHGKRWIVVFDAIGLSAFAIQGALYAKQMHYPLIAVVMAAVLTGIGGGLIRDVLAGRKPFVLREEIYAVWAMLAGLVIGLGWVDGRHPVRLYVLFAAIFALRLLSVWRNWHIPRKPFRTPRLAGRPQPAASAEGEIHGRPGSV
ncbi:trimeric intracellular cation channel family protein [Alicyclobacillus cellulosilyticus]|nr:trimeric intracellular cation channel family protein [Alicyclobacillus cellulosilyticus]